MMTRHLFSALFVLALSGLGYGQVLDRYMAKENSTIFQDAVETASGGHLIVGHSVSSTWVNSLLIVNLDANLDTLWTKKYMPTGTSLQVWDARVVATNDGGFVIAGSLYSWPDPQEVFVMKIDANGNVLWNKTLADGGNAIYPQDIIETSDGATVVVGYTTLNGSSSSKGAFALKLNSSGATVWTRKYDITNNICRFFDAEETPSGDIYVVGEAYSPPLLYTGAVMFSLSSTGALNWTKSYKTGKFQCITAMPSGDYLLGGAYRDLGSGEDYEYVEKVTSAGVPIRSMYGINSNTTSSEGVTSITPTTQSSSYLMIGNGLNPDGDDDIKVTVLNTTQMYTSIDKFLGNVTDDRTGRAYFDGTHTWVAGEIENHGVYYNFDYLANGYDCVYSNPESETSWNITTTGVSSTVNVLTGVSTSNVSAVQVSGSLVESITLLSGNTSVIDVDCNGDPTGSASVTVSGGESPYSLEWSNGPTTQNNLFLTAGEYSVIVSDSKNCLYHDTVVVNEPDELEAQSVIISPSCSYNFDGSIDLTPSGGVPPYTFDWTNGATTEDLTSLGNGFYGVTIEDANDCDLDVNLFVDPTDPINILQVAGNHVNCYQDCDGEVEVTVYGGNAPYSISWSDPQGQTGTTASNLCAGAYQVNVVDANGCIGSSVFAINEPQELIEVLTVDHTTCDASAGSASVNVTGGVTPYVYNWSSGGSSATETGLTSGAYDVTVTDANGCMVQESFTINDTLPDISICVVTVDTNSQFNEVVWTNPGLSYVSGVNVYRSFSGNYNLIGFVSDTADSKFVDTTSGANPNVTSYRYRIALVDSCGNVGPLSDYHETMHLTVGMGLSQQRNLVWDNYEGFGFTEYVIGRDTTGQGNWEFLDSVSNTQFTYTDWDVVPLSLTTYSVRVVIPGGCLADRAENYNSSRSNKTTPGLAGEPSGLTEEQLSSVVLYPNPTSDVIRFKGVGALQGRTDIRVMDMTGRLVLAVENWDGAQIDLSSFERGIYQVVLENGGLRASHAVSVMR